LAVPDCNWIHDRYLPHIASFCSLEEDRVRIFPWQTAFVRERVSYAELAPFKRFELRSAPSDAVYDIRHQAFDVCIGDLGELLPDDAKGLRSSRCPRTR
jgi:hypothetical protein